MRDLFYAGGRIRIADTTCKAVLRYARALANANKSDVVSVPFVLETGGTGLVHLTLGPASQLYSTPVLDTADEPLDPMVIAQIEAETLKLEPSRPEWPTEMPDIPDFDWDTL
jgi:hypothetical protein